MSHKFSIQSNECMAGLMANKCYQESRVASLNPAHASSRGNVERQCQKGKERKTLQTVISIRAPMLWRFYT